MCKAKNEMNVHTEAIYKAKNIMCTISEGRCCKPKNTVNMVPEGVLSNLMHYLSPLERIKLQQCCKHFYSAFSKWMDIVDICISKPKTTCESGK